MTCLPNHKNFQFLICLPGILCVSLGLSLFQTCDLVSAAVAVLGCFCCAVLSSARRVSGLSCLGGLGTCASLLLFLVSLCLLLVWGLLLLLPTHLITL